MNILRKIAKSVSVVTLLAILVIASALLAAEQRKIRKYPIPEHGTLELNVPTPWKETVHKPQENMPPTIIFDPAKGNDFQVMIAVTWGKTGDQDFNSKEKVRAYVENHGRQFLPNAAEGKIVLQEIKGGSNAGYYFSITDKAPNPGEYRYMSRGSISVGNLLLNFTILHRVKESQAVRDALSVLREAKQSSK
ncbi:MAG TPA: hypothetical protein VMV04_21055 [Thermodesulfobacteriota bacterium]|nr:hypothetical protein [Thermodesulfobacteriota bacterium]